MNKISKSQESFLPGIKFSSLSYIYFSKYRIRFIAINNIKIPGYKGFSIKDNFKESAKQILPCNAAVKFNNCGNCDTNSICAYSILFDAPVPDDNPSKRNFSGTPPHPYVIEPGDAAKNDYLPGEVFSFDLILVGKANDYIQIIKLIFHQMGFSGIGSKNIDHPERGKFKLESVSSVDPNNKETILFSVNGVSKKTKPFVYDLKHLSGIKSNPEEITIKFDTPTAISSKDVIYFKDIQFKLIVERLMERIKLLANFYCDAPYEEKTELDYDFSGISISNERLNKKSYQYQSGRQGKKVPMQAVRGEVTYTGNVDVWLPVLDIGQYLHIGKNTTFGFGKYNLTNGNTALCQSIIN